VIPIASVALYSGCSDTANVCRRIAETRIAQGWASSCHFRCNRLMNGSMARAYARKCFGVSDCVSDRSAHHQPQMIEHPRRSRPRQFTQVVPSRRPYSNASADLACASAGNGSGAVLTIRSRKWIASRNPSCDGCCLLWKRLKRRDRCTSPSAVGGESPGFRARLALTDQAGALRSTVHRS